MTAFVRGIKPGTRSGTYGADGHRTYTITYLVYTDNLNDGPVAAANAFGIPRIGDTFVAKNDSDSSAIVVQVDPRDVSPTEWEVDVDYTTDLGGGGRPIISVPPVDNPLLEPPSISYGSVARRILVPGRYNDPAIPPTSRDYELGILAPNRELFSPQPEMDLSEPVLSVTRNVAAAAFSGAAMMALANAVNSAPYQGAEARQLRMDAPQAQLQWHHVIGPYWTVTFQMVFRFETWDIQIMNQGSYYVTGGVKKPFKDEEGNRFIGNLTSTGGDLGATNPPTFTRLRVYREIDFNALGIL